MLIQVFLPYVWLEHRLDRHLLIYANDVSCYVNDTSLQRHTFYKGWYILYNSFECVVWKILDIYLSTDWRWPTFDL